MFRLDKSLKEWTKAGLITREQALRINEYESRRPESNWVLSGLLILGVMIIGIGVISLIAANWQQIPNTIKLSVDFVILTVVAWGIVSCRPSSKPIAYEVL